MSNRSEISGHKPNTGQNVRTGKPEAPSVGTGQQKVSTAVGPKITPVSDLPKPIPAQHNGETIDARENAAATADVLEQTQYAEQGKVAPTQLDQISPDLLVSEGDSGLKELAKTIDIAKLEAAEAAVNHRSGMSYADLKVAYEEEKAKAEAAGELLNKARIIINNPFHRYGQFVDSIPLGEALGMEKVWQPKASR